MTDYAVTGVPVLNQSGSIVNQANGTYNGDGTGAIVVPVGFTPRHVKVVDITDLTTWEFIEGMPATNTLKTSVAVAGTAGAQSVAVDATSAIVTNGVQTTVTEVAFGGNGVGDGTNGTQSIVEIYDNLGVPQLTFATGLNVSGKVYVWEAFG